LQEFQQKENPEIQQAKAAKTSCYLASEEIDNYLKNNMSEQTIPLWNLLLGFFHENHALLRSDMIDFTTQDEINTCLSNYGKAFPVHELEAFFQNAPAAFQLDRALYANIFKSLRALAQQKSPKAFIKGFRKEDGSEGEDSENQGDQNANSKGGDQEVKSKGGIDLLLKDQAIFEHNNSIEELASSTNSDSGYFQHSTQLKGVRFHCISVCSGTAYDLL